MALTKEKKQEIIETYGKDGKDTGSTAVQVALITERIRDLNDHFKTHKKDHAGRRGLLKMVGHRRSLLKYLKKTDIDAYRELLKKLDLRK
ncbi:MAG: 30S ribosomal protein S15 [Spirochaetota bacterium]